jgi:hypothetical protein
MKKYFSVLLSCFSVCIFAQSTTVPYTRDYGFKEGIYITASQFEQNAPISKAALISNVPTSRVDFIGEVMKQKDIVYIDSTTGKEQRIAVSNVWGYCQNKIVYVYSNKKFVRMNTIGTLCQYTGSITNVINNYNPMYSGYPGMGFPGGYPGYGGGGTTTYEELKQFIFDTKSNQVFDFTPESLEALIMDDEALFKEFMELKHRKKSEMMFIYLRRYNEKHPLMLPF